MVTTANARPMGTRGGVAGRWTCRWSRPPVGCPGARSCGRLTLEPAVSASLSAPSRASRPHLPACLCIPRQVLSPQRIPAAATPSPLMSPLVFAQPSWAPPQERSRAPLPPGNQDPAATPAGLLLPLRTPEPPGTPGSALSKPQLQEALLHLIQVGGHRPLLGLTRDPQGARPTSCSPRTRG